MAGPGNEIECELLTWTHPEQQHFNSSSVSGATHTMPGGGTGGVYSFSAGGAAVREGSISSGSGCASTGRGSSSSHPGGEPLRWARVVWRRGTVPIWWGVQLQSLAQVRAGWSDWSAQGLLLVSRWCGRLHGVLCLQPGCAGWPVAEHPVHKIAALLPISQGLQAEVYVREEHPYQGTASYFRNVQRQHQPRPALPVAGGGEQAAAGEGGGGSEGWTLVDQAGAEASAGSSSVRTSASHSSAAAALQGPGGSEGEEDASCRVPVTCINLLHANPKKASELMLSSHFQDVSLLRGASVGRVVHRKLWLTRSLLRAMHACLH